MKWFLNLATRTKLFIGFGVMVLFQLAIIIAAYNSISTIRESQIGLFQEDFSAANSLIAVRADQNRLRASILEMMMLKDRAKQEALERDIRDRAKDVDEGLKTVSEALKNQPQEHKKFDEMASLINDYRKTRDEQIKLIYSGNIAEAQRLGLTIQDERYNGIRAIEKELGDNVVARAKARITQSEKNTETMSRTFIIAGALIILISGGMVFYLNSIISSPLKELTTAADKISSGDLGISVQADDRQDEVGRLTKSFGTMTRYLQEIAAVSKKVSGGDLTVTVKPISDKDLLGNSFAEMVENLRRVNQEIRDGVNVLASSASEILASTTEVASGMTETTASVSETTATVEEVKQIAQLSAEKSRVVSEGAQKSVLVAQQGDAAVSRTVDGINNIRVLMESVAGSIVKLSEQTQAIGEIIAAVSDLAQQSNLLAVNAAIEASKAGEHGKGFTVVAQEIKSLADQSKQSTEQVRSILGDIQKATSASVLAAEQVSKAVDGGVRQAAESGEAIRRLAANIEESAQAATQIAASSQQQFAGMDQISMAMESIKQAAQQNVSGTKQAEKAAHDLNELGQKLKQIVGIYKV